MIRLRMASTRTPAAVGRYSPAHPPHMARNDVGLVDMDRMPASNAPNAPGNPRLSMHHHRGLDASPTIVTCCIKLGRFEYSPPRERFITPVDCPGTVMDRHLLEG